MAEPERLAVSLQDLDRFYTILDRLKKLPGQGSPLRDLFRGLPPRGVYFFFESGESRATGGDHPRVVRVGTHAVSVGSKSTLRGRLKQHGGTRSGGGNHRGSIFRLHVGAALLARDRQTIASWGRGSSRPSDLSESAREDERTYEGRVSKHLGAMPVCWVDVPDEPSAQSERAVIERNAIALLSNRFKPFDPPSHQWLGTFSPRSEIRESGLWNLNYVQDACDPAFLDVFERRAEKMAG